MAIPKELAWQKERLENRYRMIDRLITDDVVVSIYLRVSAFFVPSDIASIPERTRQAVCRFYSNTGPFLAPAESSTTARPR